MSLDVLTLAAAKKYTDSQISKNSGGNVDNTVSDAVKYTAQTLTEAQKAQARTNIGACSDLYANYVTPQMYGAVGDGVTDDTAAINECLANNSLVYIPNGTYLINAAIGVKPQSNQVIQLDANATLKANCETTTVDGVTVYTWATVLFDAVENIVFRGGNIEGDVAVNGYTNTDKKHGIRIRNAKKITIDDCRIFGHCGDGVDISTYGHEETYETDLTKNIKLINCEVYDCIRHGVSVDGIDGLIVKNVEIHDCIAKTYSCAIDFEIEYDFHTMHNITIDGLKSYNTSIGIQTSEKTAGSYMNFNISNCEVDRFCYGFETDIAVYNSRIELLVINSITKICAYDCNITKVGFTKRAGVSYFYNCHFESKNTNICNFEYSSVSTNVEVTFDKCTFTTYTFADDETKYAANAMLYASTQPKIIRFYECNIYINNPNGIGGIIPTERLTMYDCCIKAAYNFDGYAGSVFDPGANSVMINNIFDVVDVKCTNNDKPVINLQLAEHAKLIGNVVEGNCFAVPFRKTTAGGTVECINNIFRGYTKERINGCIISDDTTFINIGTITSDTTA